MDIKQTIDRLKKELKEVSSQRKSLAAKSKRLKQAIKYLVSVNRKLVRL